jgi:putative inorganic carbon (HCO3(-)) transporter
MPRRTTTSSSALVAPRWFANAVLGSVIAALVSVTVVLLPSLNDGYQTPKLAVLAVVAVVAVGFWVLALVESGGARLPRSVPGYLAGGIGVVLLVTTAINDHRALSVFGEYGRSGGLVAYAAALALLGLVACELDWFGVERLVKWSAGTGAFVILYGIVQVLGGEPLGAPSQGLVLSTLGQANFLAGFTGIMVPLFLWEALRATTPAPRAAWLLLVALTGIVAVETASVQSVLSLAAGLGTFALVFGLERLPRRAVGGAVVGVVILAGALGIAASSRVEQEVRSGLDERVLMWQAAREMFYDKPVLGHGPSGYAANFSKDRPAAHATRYGVFQLVDNPHSVPIAMFVTGGVVLGSLYLSFVAAVGWVLISGIRRLRGERRMLLAAVGGAWLAYQVQSLVSIDVPTLIVLHLVLAGCVLVLAGPPRFAEVRIQTMTPRGGRRPVINGFGRALQSMAALAVLVVAVMTVRVVTADAAFADARDAQASGDMARAFERFEMATSRAPWIGQYWALRAAALASEGDQDAALVTGMRAADEAPSAVSYALSTAQLAQRMSRNDVASRYFEQAVENSPKSPVVRRAYAEFLVATSQKDAAIRTLRKTIDLRVPGVEDVQILEDLHLLASTYLARDQSGDLARARQTYRRALELDATDPVALEFFGRLAPS